MLDVIITIQTQLKTLTQMGWGTPNPSVWRRAKVGFYQPFSQKCEPHFISSCPIASVTVAATHIFSPHSEIPL